MLRASTITQSDLEEVRRSVADQLLLLAELGDRRAARAREILLGVKLGGRHSIDDTVGLCEMAAYVSDGETVEHAAELVSRYRPGHSAVATCKRLARKFRAHKTS